MNNERILSICTSSMIFHKPGCRYVEKIQYKNRMSLPEKDAKKQGFHICKYCNSMNHHYRTEQEVIDYYRRCKRMQFKYINGILYVKSEIGCWKIAYIRKIESFVLYHGNYNDKAPDFTNPQNEHYHRQEDMPYCNSIEGYLEYIYNHDKYKAAVGRGETVKKFSSKKYAKRESKARKNRENRRVDYLFEMLKRQNNEQRQLSVINEDGE